ncbi:GNAT family N-acetyltransferase [Bremerella cremea]|uniref:GNAT family N-acetyltransferase n=1 Tax=Bremerella cremea TaxID=1031537 RepID=UPI0031E76DA0
MNEITPRVARMRWIHAQDMAGILAIERESFRVPWARDHFRQFLSRREGIGQVLLAETGGPLAFMLYEISAEQYHLVSLAVAEVHRRQGLGRKMMAHLARQCTLHKSRRSIRVEVPERNLPSQLFFQAAGFQAVEVLRDHYQDPDEDAFRFVWHADQPRIPPRSQSEQGS